MYEINLIKDNKYIDTYYFKTKNELNQTLYLEIFNSNWSELALNKTYNITFKINTKRKHGYQYLKQIGKDGLKSLIWAKNCIKYFIESKLKENDLITIYADDIQRFNVYTRGLKDLKFYISKIDNYKVLIYKHYECNI